MTDNTLDTQEMADLPQAVVDAQAKGDEILKLTGEDDRVLYFRKPGKADLNRMMTSIAKGKVATGVQNMVFDLLVHPTANELREQMKDKPGRLVAINNAIQSEVGLNEDFTVKKL